MSQHELLDMYASLLIIGALLTFAGRARTVVVTSRTTLAFSFVEPKLSYHFVKRVFPCLDMRSMKLIMFLRVKDEAPEASPSSGKQI